ncbi:MAG: hypothetical protein MI740_13180 [Halanaerobiales bacterium]|nr:hypothetical protein [Halanaerobiales bacterium]
MLINANNTITKMNQELSSATSIHENIKYMENGVVADRSRAGNIVKYGLKKYIGSDPLRVYPHQESFFGFEEYEGNPIVELIRGVSSNVGPLWSLVIDHKGRIGYVKTSELIDVPETALIQVVEKESLGGFRIGDRIEKAIGTLDTEYTLIYENGRIYDFSDQEFFVNNTNQITLIRTESPQITLNSGYSVGDNALEVLEYYKARYEHRHVTDAPFLPVTDSFRIGDEATLGFVFSDSEINENSSVTSIYLYREVYH